MAQVSKKRVREGREGEEQRVRLGGGRELDYYYCHVQKVHVLQVWCSVMCI